MKMKINFKIIFNKRGKNKAIALKMCTDITGKPWEDVGKLPYLTTEEDAFIFTSFDQIPPILHLINGMGSYNFIPVYK